VNLMFVYLPSFIRTADEALSDDQFRSLENQLLADPRAGDVIPHTGGMRKLRVAMTGRGRRGGARVVYYYVDRQGRVYLVLFYAKNRQATLTAEQAATLRQLAAELEDEDD
jgi:hypothetical protein